MSNLILIVLCLGIGFVAGYRFRSKSVRQSFKKYPYHTRKALNHITKYGL